MSYFYIYIFHSDTIVHPEIFVRDVMRWRSRIHYSTSKLKCSGDDWSTGYLPEFAASEKGVEPPSHRQCRNAGHGAQNVTAAPRFTLTLVVGFGYRFWGPFDDG